MSELPDYNKITFPDNTPIPFEEILPDASEESLDLVKRFLVYPSKLRIPAKKVKLFITFIIILLFITLTVNIFRKPC